jgi:hypothetical protein
VTPSGALPEYADATDANLRGLRHGLDWDQPYPELRGIESTGKMHGVDDMSDLEDEGETVAGMCALGQRRLAHAEQRDAARQKLGMLGWILAFRHVDVDAKRSGVIEAAYILKMRKIRSGAVFPAAPADSRLVDTLRWTAASSVTDVPASVPTTRKLSLLAPSSSTVLGPAMAVLLASALAVSNGTPSRSSRATTSGVAAGGDTSS